MPTAKAIGDPDQSTFLSREEAGLIEMTNLDMHEKFLARLTVCGVFSLPDSIFSFEICVLIHLLFLLKDVMRPLIRVDPVGSLLLIGPKKVIHVSAPKPILFFPCFCCSTKKILPTS